MGCNVSGQESGTFSAARVPGVDRAGGTFETGSLGSEDQSFAKTVTFGPAHLHSEHWRQLGGADSWGYSPYMARSGPSYLGQGQSSPSLVSAEDPGGDLG